MEIRYLIRILVQRWWLVVPAFLVTVASALVITLSQSPIYESSATYVVKATSDVGDDVLSALGVLSRQTQIAETYAQAGQSRQIQQRASESLSLSAEQDADVVLESGLVAGTNLLRLSCRARDADLAPAYCNAVGDALVDYAEGLYPSFELAVLDTAVLPTRPVSPNVPMNLGLGVVVGLALGVATGILAQILTPTTRRPRPRFEVIDRESSAYSGAFFLMRLRQEISRARRTGSHLAISLVNVNHSGGLDHIDQHSRYEAIRRLAGLLESHLRIEDVSARLEGDVFAILMPDTTEVEAIDMVEALRGRIAAPALAVDSGGAPVRVQPAAGVVEFHGEVLTAEDLLERARSALRDAESVPGGTTQPFSAAAQPGS